jgi:cyclopropane fatty-acyl-phospholipid synthase-like methyltransferase
MGLYKLLEIPWVYNLVQRIFAADELQSHVKQLLSKYSNQKVLELGAGTGAFSQINFGDAFVSDINAAYLDEIPLPSNRKLVMSATDLTQLSGKFDLVFSVGLYHHLSEDDFSESICQIKNHLTSKGKLIVVDNIWPIGINPIAWLVRRFDRGEYVRAKNDVVRIVDSVFPVASVSVGSYSWCRLEYVVVECLLESNSDSAK